MKIRDVQVRTVIAPLDPPVRTASGHVTDKVANAGAA